MSNPNDSKKLAFFTLCLPGSEAERKETERLAEFLRAKSERLDSELTDKPARDAARHQEYEAADMANKALMRAKRPTWTPREK